MERRSLFLFLLVCTFGASAAECEHCNVTNYELVLEQLELFYQHVSIRAILHMKAQRELAKLPYSDTISFNDCFKSAKTVAQISKCVAKVLDARNRNAALQENSRRLKKYKLFRRQIELSKQPRIIAKPRPERLQIYAAKRTKRMISTHYALKSQNCKLRNNVKDLLKFQEYFSKMDEVTDFLHNITKDNQNFLRRSGLDVEFRAKFPDLNLNDTVFDGADDENASSWLSPKLFSLYHHASKEGNDTLSPEIFSFQDSGIAPLPRLLRMSTSSECDTLRLLSFFLDITGGSTQLKKIFDSYGEHIQFVLQVLHPKILKEKKNEKIHQEVQNLMSDEQKEDMRRNGYTALSKGQLELVYGENGVTKSEELQRYDKNYEDELEEAVHQLATWEAPKGVRNSTRPKRFIYIPALKTSIFKARIFDPVAFSYRIDMNKIMGPSIFAPHAFFMHILAGTLLSMHIIAPRTFMLAVMAPSVLVLRVLSPTAFRLQILVPQTMNAAVLTPEAFLLNVLAPKAGDARVASPEALVAQVLSPTFGGTKIGSPNILCLYVLSPSFLTYNYYSGNRYVVQILSPAFLGARSNPFFKSNT
ncbi:unnamed protein product [Bursaphelenchus xylophilus]|uniref:(pine wood nematode) hypothetical protein n=1 Tax=Bursaphelenchus xylophilus TaxID=6326 RepID=A0A1I7RIW8_BURXY|nr:unnamed protein product [Bursaphelenchus xylophilus]CAG9119144.1 unnamed protein product [Bursaphelenchus xylophilus]